MRRSWPNDDVDLFKGSIEIVLDQAANLLRLAVVGIIETRRERIGANHDASLHFFAKAFAACSLVHVFKI